MTPFDLGYITGIIDGEGSITLRVEKRNPHHRPKLSISVGSTDPEMLQFLSYFMGGKASLNKGWSVCPTSCKEPHVHSRKQRYSWRINGERAWIVLHNIAPFLICKRAEAQEALKSYQPMSGYNRGRMLQIAEEMMEKGWDIACVR